MSFTDDFNRASLGSNWTADLGTWIIATSQYLKPNSQYTVSVVRVVGTFPNNGFVEVYTEVSAGAGDPTINGPAFRINGGDYYFIVFAPTTLDLYKRVSGVTTYINGVTHSPTAGTLYKVKVTYTGTNFEVFVNDVSKFTASDSAIASGSPGCYASTGASSAFPRFDDFSCTSIVGSEVYLPRGVKALRDFRIPYRGFALRTRLPIRGIPRRPRPIIFISQERPRGTFGRGIVRGSYTKYPIAPPPRTGNKLVAPFNIGETVADHFISRGWRKIQDQINAGYPYVAQPVPNFAQYVEDIDYGSVFNNVIINVDWATSIITGTVNVSCAIETSLDRNTWTTPVIARSMFAVSFRYVRVTISFTPVN